MVEIMEMQHRTEADSRLVRGIVLDHGGRHTFIPEALKKTQFSSSAYVLLLFVIILYEHVFNVKQKDGINEFIVFFSLIFPFCFRLN